MVWMDCMVHRWYMDGMHMVCRWYADGMGGLYGAQMVHRWYAYGADRSYGTKREIKNFFTIRGWQQKKLIFSW